MDKEELYSTLAERKSKPKDFGTYIGDNGRVNRAASLIRSGKLRKGGTLVDVGGGIGDLGYAVKDLFDRKIIVDISSKNLDAAESKGNETCLADVDKDGIGIDDSTVDLVCALDFIEHIVDPQNFAKECHRVLKPGGQVFINTPNIQFWRHIDTLISGHFPHTSGDKEVYHGGHLAFYTYLDLCEIFDSACFYKFEQVNDEEGYQAPPPNNICWKAQPRTQYEFQELCKRFGCPNLLFKAETRKM